MSKLYQKYIELKRANENQLYLFKSGIFFIFLEEDAKLVSNKLNLKLTKLNDTVVKCGFPINSFNKYSTLLADAGFTFSIIDEKSCIVSSTSDYLNNLEILNTINKIKKIDMNNITPIDAFNILLNLKSLIIDESNYNNK